MSLSAAVIDALVASGVTVEQLAAAMKADLAGEEQRVSEKRAKDAARQRRSRLSRAVTVTPCDAADAVPNEESSIPLSSEPKGSSEEHSPRARKADPFPRPNWAESQVWRDFMANRRKRRMTNTATAYRQFLGDIDRLADDEWPPGRLLELAAGKGWGSVNKPDQDNRNGRSNTSGGPRPDPLVAAYNRALAEESAERGEEDNSGTWVEVQAGRC